MVKPNELTMNRDESVTKHITTIGTLELYSMQSIDEYSAGLTPQQFYYTDNKYLTEWKGPFSSIYNATQHYTTHLKAYKAAIKAATGKDYIEQNPKSNVVIVNFITKQYHRPENT